MEARACELVPFLRDMTSEPARQGTLGHEVLAGVLDNAFAGDWSRASQVVATIEGRMSGLEVWTKDAVRQCAAYACALIANLSRRFSRVEIMVEEHLDGDGIAVPRGGTADLIIICYDAADALVLIVVDDHKCGFVSQGEAADHLQLAAYAVMAWDRWQPTQGVEVHLAAGRRHEFSSAHYDAATCAGVRDRIRRGVAAARVDAPELSPSRKACNYCKAILFCRAFREHLMDAKDQLALFGFDPAGRLDLADAIALAKRFAADGDAVLKQARAQEADRISRQTDSQGAAP